MILIVFHMHQLFHLFLFYHYIFMHPCYSNTFFRDFFSFICFVNCLRFSKTCGKSISFGIIDNFFVKLAIVSFCISCSSISILSRFSLAILFRIFISFSFSISRFSISLILSIFNSSCYFTSFVISLGFDIFISVQQNPKTFYNNLHIL